MRTLLLTLGLAAGLCFSASASAQTVGGWSPQRVDPWGGGAFRLPQIGQTPNGTGIVDPWGSRQGITPMTLSAQSAFAYQYAAWNAAGVWSPALAPYWQAQAALSNPQVMNGPLAAAGYGGFSPQTGFGIGPFTQIEPGRFSRVGPDLAVNRATGTVLQPYAGVAYTNEGTFLRLPGSGTFTPWGAYLPGTGVFVNPVSGALYNPQTGLILR